MMNPVVVQKLEELDALVTAHPQAIPLEVAAEFIGIKSESLKAAIEQGKCSFAFSWQKSVSGYRSFKIPTTTFYLWFTNTRGCDYIGRDHSRPHHLIHKGE